jgi:N-methylhydantoinase B
MFTTTLGAGDVFHHVMAAGGGWGPPAERPAADILRDVADGKLSPGAAKRDYGVDVRDDSTLDAAPNQPEQGEPAIA